MFYFSEAGSRTLNISAKFELQGALPKKTCSSDMITYVTCIDPTNLYIV